MTQLSSHFTLEEMTVSGYAARHGIDNTPPEGILANLRVAAEGMELVRSTLLFPIHVDSGYRCPELNAAIGGVSHSAHMKGWAVDFVCPRYGTTFDVANAIHRSKIRFDQLILEYGWVHISFDPATRMQLLTKKSKASPYVAGLLP